MLSCLLCHRTSLYLISSGELSGLIVLYDKQEVIENNVHTLFQNLKKIERDRLGYRAKCILPDFQTTSCLWSTFSDNTFVSGYDKMHIALLPNQQTYIHGNRLCQIPHLTFRILNNKRRTRMHPLYTPCLSHHAKNGSQVLWTRPQ